MNLALLAFAATLCAANTTRSSAPESGPSSPVPALTSPAPGLAPAAGAEAARALGAEADVTATTAGRSGEAAASDAPAQAGEHAHGHAHDHSHGPQGSRGVQWQPLPDGAAQASVGPAFPGGLMDRVADLIAQRFAHVEGVYRDFHQYPELSGQEKRTSAIMAAEMRQLGFDVTESVGGHGVVSVLKNGSGPTLLIRTDMDALPIQEETGLPFSSKVPGVMHACGHDFHMATFLATAYALSQLRDSWQGTIVMVAQPAEEIVAGARAMLADGLYTRFPKPDYALALHDTGTTDAGRVELGAGPVYASADAFDITLHGKGTHASRPHAGVDPIMMQAELLQKFQAVVGREVDPTEPALISVGAVHAGTKGNIIPDTARILGTIRAYNPDVRQQLRDRVKEVTEQVSTAGRGTKTPDVSFPEQTGPSHNHPQLVDRLRPFFEAALGAQSVVDERSSMGAEDFSEYSLGGQIPAVIFRVGVRDPAGPTPAPSTHSSKFAPFFEPGLKTGAKAMVAAALGLLRP